MPFERWSYNVAVAKAMAFLNDLYRYVRSDAGAWRVLARHRSTPCCAARPAAPHITAELWSRRCPRTPVATCTRSRGRSRTPTCSSRAR